MRGRICEVLADLDRNGRMGGRYMRGQRLLTTLLLLGTVLGGEARMASQESKPENPEYRVAIAVDLVQLNVAVTDNKGKYVTGLSQNDFAVFEDTIQERIATFGEENAASRRLADPPALKNSLGENDTAQLSVPGKGLAAVPSSLTAGADVFILFDTSNYMYRGFVFAQDAICEFVRSLDHPDRVAFYSYSRDFSRASLLTPDKSQVLRGVRATVVGDDAALYDALLITLKDAAQFSGKRVVVVFSNGPDNSSMVAPEDVRELAESEGIPIYMISTQLAKLDPVSTAVFERMSASTGGKAYFAKTWTEEQKAFSSIREDLAHLYSLSYYPQPNSNRGWRTITVKLVGGNVGKYHIRTRTGYRPQLAWTTRPMATVP
jgi:Ca-activated chloride channel homolog